MGGEKLKASRPILGLTFAIFFILIFFNGIVPLSAQDQEVPLANETESSAPAPVLDESSIILGETPVSAGGEGASTFGVMLRMVLVLALAALAIYGVVFFIKRLGRPQESQDPHLRVLCRVPLGNDSFAAVLSVGAKAWLVVGGSGGVNLISEIDDPESLETMLIEDAEKLNQAASRRIFNFRSLLGKLGGPQREDPHNDSGSFVENLRKQRERLKGQ